ncbi:AAA domain-containing protein [Mycena floridula]|nr:AAA domain-containing protein [Mycena floridula]
MYSFKNPNPADRPDSPTLSDDVQHSQETVVQLTENFRLNPDLGEFVSTIYSRAFKPQKAQTRHLATALKSVRDELGQDFCLDPTILESVQWCLIALSNVMLHQPQNILVPPSIQNVPYKERASSEFDAPHPISLALLRLQTFSSKTLENVGYEIHVKAEAEVAAALAVSILRCSPKDDIFIATPHRIQRHAVKAALHRAMQAIDEMNLLEAMDNFDIDEEHGTPDPEPVLKDQIRVDTVERLQGSEAAFVICLFSLPQPSAAELAFLLERRRLNVAISRAKTLCILIASPEVLRPSIHVLSNENSAKGFEFLKAFEARAWSAPINVDVEDL